VKAIGVVRKVDELGRITLPKKLRDGLDISVGDPIEIFTDEDFIILKKYQPDMTCMLTGKISLENKKIAGGTIVLSPEGATILLNEIKNKFSVNLNT